MPHVAILVCDASYASVSSGFADVLQVANAHLRKRGASARQMYRWQFVSLGGDVVQTSTGMHILTHQLQPADHFDLVIAPSLHYAGRSPFERMLTQQQPACDWMCRQWERGAWLVANCTGTFLLAETGLLDQRAATTTWWLEPQFRARYPLVDLQMRPLITEVDRIVCGGAYAAYLPQAVRVLERFSGAEVATDCARSLLIDVTQTTQTTLLPLLTDTSHGDVLVQRAQAWLRTHMAQAVRMADVASHLAVSDRTLVRRFKAVLNQPPLTYLQHLRIDAARTMLEHGDQSVEHIAECVGYSDVSSFARLFRERVGVSPSGYRGRFQSQGAALHHANT